MALTLPRARVTPAFSPAAARWMLPRPLTVVLDNSMPSWRTLLPLSVMSPVAAWITPLLTTAPAPLPATRSISTSLPRVLEYWFLSVPWPGRTTMASPAARVVWPFGVVMAPALSTPRPASKT